MVAPHGRLADSIEAGSAGGEPVVEQGEASDGPQARALDPTLGGNEINGSPLKSCARISKASCLGRSQSPLPDRRMLTRMGIIGSAAAYVKGREFIRPSRAASA